LVWFGAVGKKNGDSARAGEIFLRLDFIGAGRAAEKGRGCGLFTGSATRGWRKISTAEAVPGGAVGPREGARWGRWTRDWIPPNPTVHRGFPSLGREEAAE